MSEQQTARLTCDWTNEHGAVCRVGITLVGSDHDRSNEAHRAGWGWYANAYIRRDRWTTGARLWFCPVHSTVFKANHGWGGLEGYGPPKRWWRNAWWRQPEADLLILTPTTHEATPVAETRLS